jgi:prephenate dehydrogenase
MPQYDTVAIVGVGLIGASLGLALRERKLAGRVIGIGRTAKTLRTARDRGAIDDSTTSLAKGVKSAEIVVVCTPVEQIAPQVREIAAHAPPGALLTDAGSTKEALVAEIGDQLAREAIFVGSHPLAGSEKSGPAHARGDLFDGRVVIVTPTKATPDEAKQTITQFWQAVGARVVEMSPREHDAALAATSHVPHAIASALAAATPEEFLELVAGGWLDTTRIAAGDAELWRQILLANRDHSLRALAKFAKVLSQLRRALKDRDGEALRSILEAGKHIRDAVGS